jgi:hypothetical protein
MAENLAELPGLKEGQQVIMPIDQPIKSSGHIQVRTVILISSWYCADGLCASYIYKHSQTAAHQPPAPCAAAPGGRRSCSCARP